MKIQYNSLSIGRSGKSNQDRVLLPKFASEAFVAAIADGVGGRHGGGEAAELCISAIKENFDLNTNTAELFKRASESLAVFSSQNDEFKKMSTTLTALIAKDGLVSIGHVGDTRITHIRGSGIMARTRDQTEVQELVDNGVLSKYQARRYARRNVLLSAMNGRQDYKLQESQFSIEIGDRVLLTSDGFHGKILKRPLVKISEENISFSDFWDAIESIAAKTVFEDDATCLAIQIDK